MKSVYSSADELYDELAFAIDAAELGIWDLNPLTNTFKGNARLKTWFGLQPDEAIPLTQALRVIADTDRDRVTEAIWQALRYESGGQYDIVYTIVHPQTGQPRVVRAKGKAKFGDDRVAYRFNGILQDVTEQHRVQQLKQAGDAKFRALIEEAPVATCLFVGRELRIEVANEAMITVWGKGHSVLGLPLADALPELREQHFLTTIDRVFTSGEPFAMKAGRADLVINDQLTTFYFDYAFKPLHDETGAIYAIMEMAVDVTEQVLAQQKLQESETYFRQLTDTVPVMLWETTADGYCTYLNRQWYETTGQSRQEAEGLGWLDATHPDDRAEAGRLFGAANTHQEPFNLLYRLRQHDGTYRWSIDRGSPRFDASGTYLGMVGTVVDVHDETIARQQADESEVRFQTMAEGTDVLIAVSDETARITYVNQAWTHLTGRPADSLMAFGWTDLVHPDERDSFVDFYVSAFASHKPFASEFRLRSHTGDYCWLLVKGVPRHRPNGSFAGYISSSIDITGRKQSEAEVRASEQRFQAAISAVQGILWTNNARGEMAGEQPGWASLTGQTYDEYQGYGWASAVHPDDVQPTIDAWTEALRQRSTFIFEHRVRTRAGQWEVFSIRAIPLLNPDGSVREWVGVHTNINRQRRAEEAMRASEARLRSLIESAPVAIGLFVGRDLRIDLPNQTFIEVVGKGPDIAGRPLGEVMPELANQPFLALLSQVYESGQLYQSQGVPVQIMKDGVAEQKFFNVTFTPLFDEAGAVYAVLDISVDVTEQVLAQQELERQRTYLQNALTIANLGTFAVDLTTNRATFSGNIRGWFGLPSVNEPMDRVFSKIHPDDQPRVREIIGAAQAESHGHHDLTYRVLNPAAGTLYIQSYGKAHYKEGKAEQIIGVLQNVTPQIEARQRLEASEAKFSQLIEESSVAMLLSTGPDSRIEVINETMLGYVGRDASIIGRSLPEALPELANQPFFGLLSAVYQTGEPYQATAAPTTLLINGELRTAYFNLNYKPLRTATGEVYGVLHTATDVTPQVQARQKIEQSEARFRSLIEEAPVATCVFVGRELRIEVANDTMLGYWGRGQSVIGQPLAKAMPELNGQPFLQLLDEVYTSGKTYEAKADRVELVIDGALGTYYFDYTYKPLFDEAGAVYAIMEMAVDVTDEVMTRRKIEEAEAALRGAVELAELATWDLDIQRGAITYSKRFMEWLGFSEDTANLDQAYNPLPDDYRQSVPEAMQACWAPGGSGFYENEHPIINRLTGQTRIIHAQAQVRYDANGQPTHLSGTAQDVTEQRRVQQELERQVAERTQQLQASVHDLERSNANLQQFAYVASHDLQEPLRKIMSFGNLLADQYRRQLGEGTDLLERMQAAASRMSTLISDLLTFSRINTRQESAAAVSLEEVVSNALLDLDLRIQETGAVIDVGPLPTVQGDASQLSQLFQNLLTNALKFSKPDTPPHVQIGSQPVRAVDLPPTVRPARPAEAYYRIDVRDNGIGFDEKYTDRIFQVFQRLHGRSQYAGTGIGLAICEKVVANHGGVITAHSQPSEGATFSVYLPVGE